MPSQSAIELSFVLPCLNEAETLAACISVCKTFIQHQNISAEIIVADNGSTDDSQKIARENGVRLVVQARRGYGSILKAGINAAHGKYILMADSDMSYDFSEAGKFLEKLRAGNDIVFGCRFPKGGGIIKQGAMPWANRYIGTPIIGLMGRILFKSSINDFNCGMRAFTKSAIESLNLKQDGMEYASEMIAKAHLHHLRIAEVPITLHVDKRNRKPHLRPIRDGVRHVICLLRMYFFENRY